MRLSKTSQPGRVAELLLVLAACLMATFAIRARTELSGPGSPYWNDPVDHWKFEYLAEHPIGSFHISPTCWRIGVPILTRLLPFSTYRNYETLGLLFATLTGVAVYYWLLAIPRPRDEAVLGVLLFYSMGAVVKLVLAGVESADLASYFFTVLALYAIYADNDWLCAITLALGVVMKETLMVVVPLHYTLKAVQLLDWQRLKRSVIVALPAVTVFLALHILIPAWNTHADYVQSLGPLYTEVHAGEVKFDMVSAFKAVVRIYREMRPLDVLRIMTWGSLGLTLFLPFFNVRANKELVWRWSPFWIATLGSLLIAFNADRRVGSLFPLLIVASLNGIRVLAKMFGASIRDFWIVFLLQFALLMIKRDAHVVPFDIVAAVFLASMCWLLAHRSQPFSSATASP